MTDPVIDTLSEGIRTYGLPILLTEAAVVISTFLGLPLMLAIAWSMFQ